MADVTSYFVPFDLDTGGGTELILGVGLRISASGGSIEAKGQQAMATSIPVVIASDQSAVNIGTIAGAITPGTGATNLGKAEDLAFASADVGVGALAIRRATPANESSSDGDYEFLQMSVGRLWVSATIDAALPTGANTIGSIAAITTSVTPGTSAAHLGKAEDAPAGSGDTGVMALGVQRTTAVSDAVDGDYVPMHFDANGRLQVSDPNAGAGSPTSPINDYITSAAVAAGATANLDTPEITTGRKLTAVEAWSSVAYRIEVWKLSNGADEGTEPMVIGGGVAMDGWVWVSPNKDYVLSGSTSAGVDGWRFKMKNLDDNQAADMYLTYHYES